MLTFVSKLLRRPLIANALALYAVQGLNFLLPLLLLPYLLRVMGKESYGYIIFAQSLMGYATILTDFGFNLTAARDISVARESPEDVARIYWSTLFAKCLLLLASAIILSIVVAVTPSFREHWPIFAASSLLVLGSVAFPQWYFQGLERLKDVAVFQGVAKCLIAGSAVVFVRSPRDAVVAAVILSAPQLAATLVAAAIGKRMMPVIFYRPGWRDIREALQRGWHMFLSSISASLYLNTNTFVLGLLAGPGAVAFYNVGSRLASAIQGLAGPVTQSIFPRASLLFAEQPAHAWALLRRAVMLLLPSIAMASLAVALFAPWIARLIGGGSIAGAVPVIRIMAVLPVLVTSAALLAQVVMVNLNMTRQLLGIYFTVGILNLVLLVPLILRYGAVGAAVALVIAETVGPVLMMIAVMRHRRSGITPIRPNA